MSAADTLIDLVVGQAVSALAESLRDLAAPVLVFVPSELQKAALDELETFAGDAVRAVLERLQAHGKLTITTTGEIAITHHTGAHPADTEV